MGLVRESMTTNKTQISQMRGFNLTNEFQKNSSSIIITSSSFLACTFHLQKQERLIRTSLCYGSDHEEKIRILTPQENETYLENKTSRVNNFG